MVAPSDLAEAFIAGQAPHLQKTGKAMKCLAYDITRVVQNDTVTLDDFSVLANVLVWYPATGAYDSPTVVGNVVTLTTAGTGAAKVLAWGY